MMATVDLYNNLSAATTLAPAVRTESANGTGVDLQGYEGALVIVQAGTVTDGTHTIEVQESIDNSTFTAVSDGDLQGTEPAITSSNDEAVYEIGYRGTKRYIRAVVTVTGSPSTGGVYGALVVRGNPRKYPV